MTSVFTSFEPIGNVSRSVTHGRRSFPSRTDYERAFAEADGGNGDAWRDPAFAAAAMRHWHATGQTGCLFARRLGMIATQTQWASLVVPGVGGAELQDAIAGRVRTGLREAIESPGCEVLSLLFPQVTTPEGLGEVCRLLGEHTPITVAEDRSHPGTAIVALRLDISGDGKLSWIMAFGPFAEWPPTRRGPLLELAIRVKPKPSQLFHKLNQDPKAAHLADTNPSLTDDQMEKFFDRTERTTRNVLGGDPDHRSAAKATFSFPADEWSPVDASA